MMTQHLNLTVCAWMKEEGDSGGKGGGKREGGDIAFDCRGREDGRIYLSELKLKLRGKAARRRPTLHFAMRSEFRVEEPT